MVCSIQMGSVGSRMATPILAKHREPAAKQQHSQSAELLGRSAPPARRLTGADQDVRVLQQRQQRRPLHALQQEVKVVTQTGASRTPAGSTLTPGQILEGCRMHICKAERRRRHRGGVAASGSAGSDIITYRHPGRRAEPEPGRERSSPQTRTSHCRKERRL